jgi:hypothetical protein
MPSGEARQFMKMGCEERPSLNSYDQVLEDRLSEGQSIGCSGSPPELVYKNK